MARQNVPLVALNRGLVSPKALARVDLDRTRLSAEQQVNWISSTQGSMSLRPGTKYMGSVACDTGAELIEFVASTDDVALLELTHDTGTGKGRMRVWMGDDAHNLSLLSRPKVDTTVSVTDTGWENASTGGAVASRAFDAIPVMTGSSTSGVVVTASSEQSGKQAWRAADDDNSSAWESSSGDAPQWLKVDFGTPLVIASYSIRAAANSIDTAKAPFSWQFQGNDVDTGTGWTTLDSENNQTGWGVSEKRIFDVDTPQAFRFYRWNITPHQFAFGRVHIAEVELFEYVDTGAGASTQVVSGPSGIILNAGSIGGLARGKRRVVVDTGDAGVEHSLLVDVGRGPVTIRVGSTDGDDDYVSETSLGTGHHSLAFTPAGDFYITLQSNAIVDRIVRSIAIGDSGVVEIETPWTAEDLDGVRYDQSADIVYVDCDGIRPRKIERRGIGRSWSVVDYAPDDGPFLPAASSSAKLRPNGYYGNILIRSDVPFFQPGHVDSLIRMFHSGQGGIWPLGALDAATDPVEVTGIGDTGVVTPANNERRIIFDVSGSWSGQITIERSFDGPEFGFRPITDTGLATDTGTFTTTIDDKDDNISAWYRAKISRYNSGVAVVRIFYGGGGTTGIARITGYNDNQEVEAEVLSRFSDIGPTDNWQEGWWSDRNGYPTAVALHGGRLWHAGGANVFGSVSDDYESFDESVAGNAGPIIKTLGSGPVDSVHYLISLLRLIIGTAGAEIAVRSSSLDEPLTPTNSNAIAFSTQGSAPLRGLKMDTRAIMVQRSRQRVFMLGAGVQGASFGDYEGLELTLLVPDLLEAKVKSLAIQRQPDTRLHFVLEDGTVAILLYEPTEEVICWFKWETDGFVERAAVLPGVSEDAVFYVVRREINGQTKRFLEKWAKESECVGDTGLTWLMDAAVSYTDTGHTNVITGLDHLVGEEVIVWSSDTGSIPGVDRSPDINGTQRTYTVDTGGSITLDVPVHHAVVGLPYEATWKSTKLAYAAQAGTALNQMKRVTQMGMVLHQTHSRALQYGADTGALDHMPRVYRGKELDPDHIFKSYDEVAISFPSGWDPDTRIIIKAKAPRPATIMALVPTVQTNERV